MAYYATIEYFFKDGLRIMWDREPLRDNIEMAFKDCEYLMSIYCPLDRMPAWPHDARNGNELPSASSSCGGIKRKYSDTDILRVRSYIYKAKDDKIPVAKVELNA